MTKSDKKQVRKMYSERRTCYIQACLVAATDLPA